MRFLIFLLVLTLIFSSCKKENKNEPTNKETTENKQENEVVSNGKHCFYSKIEENSLELNAEINNNNITGNYNYYPQKGNANKGVFTGTLEGNIAHTVCEFTQNGKKIKEELIFRITKDKVSILGGEKEEKDGIWRFKDASKGIYMNDIPRKNCN